MTLPPLTLVKRELLGSVQLPAAQTSLPRQACPQPPQWLRSVASWFRSSVQAQLPWLQLGAVGPQSVSVRHSTHSPAGEHWSDAVGQARLGVHSTHWPSGPQTGCAVGQTASPSQLVTQAPFTQLPKAQSVLRSHSAQTGRESLACRKQMGVSSPHPELSTSEHVLQRPERQSGKSPRQSSFSLHGRSLAVGLGRPPFPPSPSFPPSPPVALLPAALGRVGSPAVASSEHALESSVSASTEHRHTAPVRGLVPTPRE
jgi:hypothetical protein